MQQGARAKKGREGDRLMSMADATEVKEERRRETLWLWMPLGLDGMLGCVQRAGAGDKLRCDESGDQD